MHKVVMSAARGAMTSFYLGLALLLALTVNARAGWLRALGRLCAATAMGFLAWSIVLANQDGTFAAVPAGDRTPLLLNIEGGLIGLGALMLVASLPFTWRRAAPAPPFRSTGAAYGQIGRGLHWASAALIIPAFTMGQFVRVLPSGRPDRAEFLATHMAIGLAVGALVLVRLGERLARPAPANPPLVRAAHGLLYAVLIALVLTGLALAPVLGLHLPASAGAEALHRVGLPALLALLLAAHLAGAVTVIRRMAR